MSNVCPTCGGVTPDDETCEERFGRCLALEFADAAYGQVHHLTVPSYYLQHNLYSRQGWIESRRGLAAALRDGMSAAELRRRNRTRMDSNQRNWNVTRGAKLEEVREIHWRRSLAEVRLEPAQVYCAEITRWAQAVLEDSEALARRVDGDV